jgi:predicted nuclease with RNAse H fold
VITLGIDLASQPEDTAAWFLEWASGRAETTRNITRDLTDRALLELVPQADRVAIDAPFGWPDDFVEAVASWRDFGTWPGPGRDQLKFRETDRAVRSLGQNPLSVAADKIAVTAMRCVHLLHELSRLDASRAINRLDGSVVEAYPAAAFRSWGIQCSGYKGKKPANLARRREVVAELVRKAPWLALTDEVRVRLEASDHQLDALVCAVVARAATVEETILPTAGQIDKARREGWIHVPSPGSLTRLGEIT